MRVRNTPVTAGVRAIAAVVGLLLLGTSAGTAPVAVAEDRRARIAQALEDYNRLADMRLPLPSPGETGDIVAGKVVKLRKRMEMLSPTTNKLDHRIRIVGYRLIERPRLLVWLAALDVGTEHSDRLTEHVLSADDQGGSVWYQHLRLPWPLHNRHWTIENRKSVELTAATGGLVWEHAWRLAPGGADTAARLLADGSVDGLSGRKPLRAIYLPANRGGWTMFELDDRLTLVATHATVELGGIIPDSLVASYVGGQLEKMLNGLVARSDVMDVEYDTSYTIYTGAGTPITRNMATEAVRLERKRGAARATGGDRRQ